MIVDALLGTGLRDAVRADIARVIHAINAAGRPVFALDVPSGLDSDAGVAARRGSARRLTITFVGLKTGLFVGDGPEYCGTVVVRRSGGRRAAHGAVRAAPDAHRRGGDPRRRCRAGARAANKGDFGRVLIVGSGSGMPGAVRLAGEACLRAGAGLTTVAVAPENVAAIAAGRPELICVALTGEAVLADALARADVVAIGPGLGPHGLGAQRARRWCSGAGKPLVVDADALNLLAETRQRPRARTGS